MELQVPPPPFPSHPPVRAHRDTQQVDASLTPSLTALLHLDLGPGAVSGQPHQGPWSQGAPTEDGRLRGQACWWLHPLGPSTLSLSWLQWSLRPGNTFPPFVLALLEVVTATRICYFPVPHHPLLLPRILPTLL